MGPIFNNLDEEFKEFCNNAHSELDIRNLGFSNTQFNVDDSLLLKRAIMNSKIWGLIFSNCHIGQCLPCIQETGKITGLSMENCENDKEGIEALRKMMPKLWWLSFASGSHQTEFMKILKETRHGNLEQLYLQNLSSECSDLCEVLTKGKYPSLSFISITDSAIDDRCLIKLLQEIQESKSNLKHLNVSFNNLITNESTRHILQCLRSSLKLEKIVVDETSIPQEERVLIYDLRDRKKSKSFRAISAICAAKYHPRLALPGCWISKLPYELIQRINSALSSF